jgi:hypothetical protein
MEVETLLGDVDDVSRLTYPHPSQLTDTAYYPNACYLKALTSKTLRQRFSAPVCVNPRLPGVIICAEPATLAAVMV